MHLRTLELIFNFKIFPNCSLQDKPFSDLFICLNQETLQFVACNLELYYDERTYKYPLRNLREESNGKIPFPTVCSFHALRSEECNTGNL